VNYSEKIKILYNYLKSERVCKEFVSLDRAEDKININDILESLEFSKGASILYKKKIVDYVDNKGYFTREFYKAFNADLESYEETVGRFKLMRDEADAYDTIIVDRCFNLENTLKALRINKDLRYKLPDDYNVAPIRHERHKLQFGRLLVVTESRPVPYVLVYTYRCERCGYEERHNEKGRKVKCPECGIFAKVDDARSTIITVYASQVMIGDHARDTISMVPLPQGQIDAAVIPKMEENDYVFFVLAVNQPDPVDVDIEWNKKDDRLMQMISIIDKIHKERMNKSINGMHHYKMAILLSRFIGVCGDPSSNILIAGDAGTGKTSTARFYAFSIASVVKLQDITRLSIPGLLGSSGSIVFNGQRIPLLQPGLVERCDIAVLDEFYDKTNHELNKLKSSLSESTISSELHENRRSVKKRAVVIATANIPYYHLRRVQERQRNLSGATSFFESMSLRNIPPNIKEEFLKENLNWRDGEDYSLLDRFPLIFYVEQKDRSDDDISLDTLVGDDKKFSDDELHRMIHIPVIEQYMMECSKIKFVPDQKLVDGIKHMINKYYIKKGNIDYEVGDDIHSYKRLQENFDRFLRYHAMINGRDRVNDSDIEWIDKFYSKTCNFVYTDELFWDNDKPKVTKEKAKDDTVLKQDQISVSIESHLSAMQDKQDKRDGIVSACSLMGLKSDVVVKTINGMVANKALLHIPPNIYKLP